MQQYPYNLKSDSHSISFAKTPSDISGYTPTNKKLLSAAFITCFVSMYGQECKFSPAFITDSNVSVKLSADLTSGTISSFIENYSSSDMSTIAMFAVIPESGWAYNQYKNDYNLHSTSNSIYVSRQKNIRASNQAQAVTGSIGAIAGMAGSIIDTINPVTIATGRAGTAIQNVSNSASNLISNATNAAIQFSGIDDITQDLVGISESYNAPATGSSAASNGYIATGKTKFTYGYKVPPLDLVKRCDKFLSIYGYKQSEYRTINLHARSNWTYIRTIGLNATGNFPDDDMKVIKQVFDKGVFFWSYTAQFGNFDQDNPIV